MMHGMEGFGLKASPGNWDGLKKFNEPAMQVLAKFVHCCSTDSATRTLSVTQFVTSQWQLAGRSMSPQMPSTIVINGHDLVPDVTDLLASKIVSNSASSGPGVHREGLFMNGSPEDAPRAMAVAIKEKLNLGKVTAYNESIHSDCEEKYFAAQRTGFGYGPSRSYADAWHDAFGLITDRNDELILRIDRPQDRAAFRKAVIEGDERLRQPLGYGKDLELVPKHIAVSGSLPVSLWDANLADGNIDLGLPLLMLPSVAKVAPEITNEAVFDFITSSVPESRDERIEEPANLLPGPWFEKYGNELRSRLRHLPADYEYTMQKLARQLFPVCLHIANWCGTYSGSSPEQIMAMTNDLCSHAMRGLVWSVAGLAWHGLGFDTGCSQKEMARLLKYLRERDPMTKSELRRGIHIGKDERDQLLEFLAAEDLVRLSGKMVEASSFADFVESVYARSNLPEPGNHWASIRGKDPIAA